MMGYELSTTVQKHPAFNRGSSGKIKITSGRFVYYSFISK
jgi:hypothetical protein